MNIVPITVFLALFYIIWIMFKYARNRKYYSKYSRKLGFFTVIGNLVDLLTSARFKTLSINIHIVQLGLAYHQLFKRESFFIYWLSFWPFLVAHKAKAVEDIISASKNIEKSWIYEFLHPWVGTGLFTSSGRKWKSRRKLLSPAFHFDILKDFIPIFNEQSRLLVKILEKEKENAWVDIVQPIQLCSLDIICETILGVSVGAQKDSESEYVRAVEGATKSLMKRGLNPFFCFDWCFNLSPTGFQFRKYIKILHKFTRKVIADKKRKLLSGHEGNCKRKRKALMDLLLEQHLQNQAITEEDIREEVDTFMFGGHDTTSTGISFALYLIGLHQNVQEKVHEELNRIFGDDYERDITTDDLKDMEYLDRLLKESHRLYPPVFAIARSLSEDTMICETKFPKNLNVALFIYALHRDETVFPNPEKFDPDRFLPENVAHRNPFAYIPFSAGPRNCIGQRFAVMEEKVVIANILRNYWIESLDPRDQLLPCVELTIKPANPIRMRLKSRREGCINNQ